MKNLPDPIFSLEPSSQDEEIIRATALQIQKDFAEFSFIIEFSGKILPPYQELFNVLHPLIIKMSETQRGRLTSLLYRIDVSPSDIDKAKKEKNDLPLTEIITDQIIRRELKKVLYRKYFR